MSDYARPLAQWADSVDRMLEVALPPWSWRFDSAEQLYVLQEGRPSVRSAFVPSGADPTLYVMVEQVNGEAEALLMQSGDVITQYI
jgi:hypothetical protein